MEVRLERVGRMSPEAFSSSSADAQHCSSSVKLSSGMTGRVGEEAVEVPEEADPKVLNLFWV